jgi:hypothetical protein
VNLLLASLYKMTKLPSSLEVLFGHYFVLQNQDKGGRTVLYHFRFYKGIDELSRLKRDVYISFNVFLKPYRITTIFLKQEVFV